MNVEEFRELCEKKLDRIVENAKGRKIYIWGAGIGGRIVKGICQEHKIKIYGFCDKKADVIKEYLGYPVYCLCDMNPYNDYLIISCMNF